MKNPAQKVVDKAKQSKNLSGLKAKVAAKKAPKPAPKPVEGKPASVPAKPAPAPATVSPTMQKYGKAKGKSAIKMKKC
jgi:hypothetical protein